MVVLERLVRERADAIAERWLADALATYAAEASVAFGRERDPFANPVGHALREGTRGIVAALVDDVDDETVRHHLNEMVRIRAIQEFSPSQALAFVFRLKDAVSAELGSVARDPGLCDQLRELDRRIDRIGLAAFDSYVACREQVFELRVNEVRRSVAWAVDRLNRRDAETAGSGPPAEMLGGVNGGREESR